LLAQQFVLALSCKLLYRHINGMLMATLAKLVTTMAWITGLPRSTVFAYGRFAREAGHITQRTRGPGAAQMSVRDAANLVMAVCGTDVTRKAGITIEALRAMKAMIAKSSQPPGYVLAWLSPLGLKQRGDMASLNPNFGSFLEYLIETAASGDLQRFLSGISLDLRVSFDRSTPLARVEIRRRRHGSADNDFALIFGLTKKAARRYTLPADLEITARISAATFTALGFTVTDKQLPSNITELLPDLSELSLEQEMQSRSGSAS
jgi:hypothetical protein